MFLILDRSIFELWGTGVSYEELHKDVVARTQNRWVCFFLNLVC